MRWRTTGAPSAEVLHCKAFLFPILIAVRADPAARARAAAGGGSAILAKIGSSVVLVPRVGIAHLRQDFGG
ncbi:MAG: hypothetical protein HY813_03955 [Candidatus Portnoybacteria bacterium]|nr:hypothetical protein [Candidatus Portnoybacteria bacterium]